MIPIAASPATPQPITNTLDGAMLPIVDKYMKKVRKKHTGGGLLDLYCGAGKTVIGLNIISQLRKKTLIIVHKSFLMQQWEERIKEFLPTARVGKIQGQITDEQLKQILLSAQQPKREFKINRV